ncbi:hypothetical protein G6F65_021877 [Rhizopus arrhizus]|nr:hypothetical protein G6F65_021877 [Rhizopus arrhizus]
MTARRHAARQRRVRQHEAARVPPGKQPCGIQAGAHGVRPFAAGDEPGGADTGICPAPQRRQLRGVPVCRTAQIGRMARHGHAVRFQPVSQPVPALGPRSRGWARLRRDAGLLYSRQNRAIHAAPGHWRARRWRQ